MWQTAVSNFSERLRACSCCFDGRGKHCRFSSGDPAFVSWRSFRRPHLLRGAKVPDHAGSDRLIGTKNRSIPPD